MNAAEIFGTNVFNESVMKERLPQDVFEEVRRVMAEGGQISKESADIVANAMKDWAIEKGATHYSHWFQPMNGVTAEKHEAFLTAPVAGRAIERLTGKQLIMGESDASSFPSGGLRATHYARGYTAWELTSPAFVKETAAGTILCIPTVFISYTGEALDSKTPLLRSMEAINKQSLRILRLFGNTEAKKVIVNVGPEQEYFLVDRRKYLERRDMIYTGRTLFGAPAPKGQELEDQYFGAIRERVGAFMADVNVELWKMGIPATTQHNEAAPGQHELAPIYAPANIAVDQNQLAMETMKRIATKHGLVCLLHEKPYAGVNGSGKHNNWSLGTDTGENLLDPGDSPNENLQFLLVLACIMKATDVHADLLRQSAANPGNEHRLGANEAPPAIISMFLGEQLEDVVGQIVESGMAGEHAMGVQLHTGVSTVPVLNVDATDRNRTSPLAFTGNKFEFRMVGSSDSIAAANTTLNAIVADAFCDAADALEGSENFEADCRAYIAELMKKHQRVIFNGDGYSEEWVAEAAERGLPNIPSMVEATAALTTQKAIDLFGKFGIYTKSELLSREEICYEGYAKNINIEAQTMIHMTSKKFIPTVIGYTTTLAQSINSVTAACPTANVAVQTSLLMHISDLLAGAQQALDRLIATTAKVNALESAKAMALAFHDEVVPVMNELRGIVDALELLVDKAVWPVPTYGDLMFEL